MTELRKTESELDEGLRLGSLLWPQKMAAELRRLHEENQTLRTALAQPEPEPMAWMNPRNNAVIDARKKKQIGEGDGYPRFSVPLYAPPKREWSGLSVSKAEDLLGEFENDPFEMLFALDKYLREKNGG
jgi:hypothetical protein